MDFAEAKTIFKDNKVITAILVDDAFDLAPTFDEDDLNRALSLLETDDAVEEAYKAAGGTWPANLESLTDQLKRQLTLQAKLRASYVEGGETPLARLAQAVFGRAAREMIDQLAPLDTLQALLESVGVTPEKFGAKGPPDNGPKSPLIFMDYFLGEDRKTSVDASISRVRKLISRYDHGEMPIVILMSSELTDAGLIEEFRAKAELLGCQFKFFRKDQFRKEQFTFVSELTDRVQFINQMRIIAEFLKSWWSALDVAVLNTKAEVSSLDLQDYFYIWEKAGRGKNQRYGEHVQALFSGRLKKLIEDNETLNRKSLKMNELEFGNELPPAPFIPSIAVAKLAHAAAFQDLEPIRDEDKNRLGLELGDVFISESRKRRNSRSVRTLEASIVISPACDLEHGKLDTVLMIDGDIRTRTALESGNSDERVLRTDIFQFTNGMDEVEDLIIEWDARRLRTVSVVTFHAEMDRQHFQRVARLRSVHALALQQKFAAQMTRVGMPDVPPVYRYTSIEVGFKSVTGPKALIPLVAKADMQACVIGETGKRVIIMEPILESIRAAVAKLSAADMDAKELDSLQNQIGDLAKVRAFRRLTLDKHEKQLGVIKVRDSDTPLDLSKSFKGKVLLEINLFSGT